MSDPEKQILDPATLAENAALQVFYGPEAVTRNIEDTERLEHLDQAAEDLGIKHSRYWVEATRGVALPAELYFEAGEEVRYEDLHKLTFEGVFACYARVQVGRIESRSGGVNPVNALCLAFSEGLFLPGMQKLDEDEVLYVPVLAVDTIDPMPMAA